MTTSAHSAARRRRHTPEDPDQVQWAGEIMVEGYGATVLVRVSDAGVLADVRRIVPPGARAVTDGVPDAVYSVIVRQRGARRVFAQSHRLYEADACVCETGSRDILLAALDSAMQFTLARHARTNLFVHAGVVGWRHGAIVVPGRTHTGKSSLVAALVRAGATYYSDEYAILDDAGLVHPFARPLGLRDALGHTKSVPAVSFGAAVADAPAPVSLVIATQHVRGARWRPAAMSCGETVLALLDNTLAAQTRFADALRILSAVARCAHGWRGARGDADRVAERILSSCPPPSI